MCIVGMTNAEVLHQVEHGYRMQAPQVGISERFILFFLMFLLARRQMPLFTLFILAYILPNILSFQVAMSKNFFLHDFLYLVVGLCVML